MCDKTRLTTKRVRDKEIINTIFRMVEKEMRDFAGGAGEKKRKVNYLGICSSFLWNVWNEIPIGLYR